MSQINENDSLSRVQIQIPMKKKKEKKRIRGFRKSYKRLSNNPVYMPALRILKRDIRRKYADMMNNVLNSDDRKLIWNFFRDFSTPMIQTVHNTFNDDLRTLYPTVISGLEQTVNIFCKNFIVMPDIVFRIMNVKICKRSDSSGSRIIALTTKRGTLLYSMKKRNLLETSEMMTTEAIEGPNADELLTPLQTPINYSMKDVIIFNLDHEHRFVSIDIEPITQ